MKLILLLITINLVFGGKCPLKEVITPCICDEVNCDRNCDSKIIVIKMDNFT